MIRTFVALSCLALSSSGCAMMNSGPDDPLTGTWTNTSCYNATGMPDDVASCSLAITFAVDLSVTLVDARLTRPANITTPRCTTTRRTSQQQYSTMPDSTLTIRGNGTATVERTDCLHPEDNSVAMPDATTVLPNGTISYQISGNTLTIATGPLTGMYTR